MKHLLLCLLLLSQVSLAAEAPAPLIVDVGISRPLTVDAALMRELPRYEIAASDHGVTARFEGVALRDVLVRAGFTFGDSLRGAMLSKLLLVSAADGYRVVFALPELDAGFRDRMVLLADRRDGKPLSAQEGPYRLVVPDEQRPARWVRQLSRIELRSALN